MGPCSVWFPWRGGGRGLHNAYPAAGELMHILDSRWARPGMEIRRRWAGAGLSRPKLGEVGILGVAGDP
jgi:hypothetical protein